MNLNDIKREPIPRKRRTRIGRGSGSGKGCTSGKGMKGQNSRSGVTLPRVFEGGTMPLYRRIPKRGFNNARFQAEWFPVNIEDLNIFKDGDEVTPEALAKLTIVTMPKSKKCRVKLLGHGDLHVKELKVKVHKISKSAQEKLEGLGGSVQKIEIPKYKRRSKKVAQRRKDS